MKYAGSLLDWGEETPVTLYTNDWKTFYDSNNCLISDDRLKRWALWLNSPWAYEYKKYHVEYNFDERCHLSPSFEDSHWRCYLEVVGYDGATGVIYGYGNTPEGALAACMSHNEHVQSTYNPERDSV